MTLDLLVSPLPGPALTSRLLPVLALIVIVNSLLLSAVVNVAFWRERLGR
ncbi:hypothetical protein [Glycomyces sp. YM15]|nr:hypothetical protein [Glycomyces sp. YM15]